MARNIAFLILFVTYNDFSVCDMWFSAAGTLVLSVSQMARTGGSLNFPGGQESRPNGGLTREGDGRKLVDGGSNGSGRTA